MIYKISNGRFEDYEEWYFYHKESYDEVYMNELRNQFHEEKHKIAEEVLGKQYDEHAISSLDLFNYAQDLDCEDIITIFMGIRGFEKLTPNFSLHLDSAY